jgi:hypothetical protein
LRIYRSVSMARRLVTAVMPRIPQFLLLAMCGSFPGVAWSVGNDNVATQDRRNLLTDSPFSAAIAAADAPGPGALEFRGVVREDDAFWINLYDPVSKHSQWNVVPGVSGPGLHLESYDPVTEHLVIVQAGRRLELALRRARVLLPAEIRPLVIPLIAAAPAAGATDRNSFVRQLPPEAREMLEQAQRRRHPLVPDHAVGTAEFTQR